MHAYRHAQAEKSRQPATAHVFHPGLLIPSNAATLFKVRILFARIHRAEGRHAHSALSRCIIHSRDLFAITVLPGMHYRVVDTIRDGT